MDALQPRLAEQADIQEFDRLLCSAQKQIRLKDSFCGDGRREERVQLFTELCQRKLVWIVRAANHIGGLLILYDNKLGEIDEIAYIVVAESLRGQGIVGPLLVRHAQTLGQSLKVEARNEHSCRLLQKCGFRKSLEVSQEGDPIFTWSK